MNTLFNYLHFHKLENVELSHAYVDHVFASVYELGLDTLKDEGFIEFADVMFMAKVVERRRTDLGDTIFLEYVSEERLEEFCNALAGYCNENDYQRWFNL